VGWVGCLLGQVVWVAWETLTSLPCWLLSFKPKLKPRPRPRPRLKPRPRLRLRRRHRRRLRLRPRRWLKHMLRLRPRLRPRRWPKPRLRLRPKPRRRPRPRPRHTPRQLRDSRVNTPCNRCRPLSPAATGAMVVRSLVFEGELRPPTDRQVIGTIVGVAPRGTCGRTGTVARIALGETAQHWIVIVVGLTAWLRTEDWTVGALLGTVAAMGLVLETVTTALGCPCPRACGQETVAVTVVGTAPVVASVTEVVTAVEFGRPAPGTHGMCGIVRIGVVTVTGTETGTVTGIAVNACVPLALRDIVCIVGRSARLCRMTSVGWSFRVSLVVQWALWQHLSRLCYVPLESISFHLASLMGTASGWRTAIARPSPPPLPQGNVPLVRGSVYLRPCIVSVSVGVTGLARRS
jgi:hypothetical protein